jgi:hypothetical protein
MGIVLKNVNITGGKLNGTVEFPAGGAAPSGRELMKTGQTVSVITGDDGDLQEGRDVDWLTLDYTNPFGNTDRFTDIFGTQMYATKIVIDWSTFDNNKVLGTQFDDFVLTGFNTLADTIAFIDTYSLGGFSNWRCPNFNELWNWMKKGQNNLLDYPPFNYTAVNIFRSNTQSVSGACFSVRPDSPNLSLSVSNTTNSARPFPVRTFTVSGTTLT